MKGVALVGFMGAGKTTVGRTLAARLGWPFVDLDERLVERFGPIALQVARDGLPAFRAREAVLVRELCDGVRRVLATGGGTFQRSDSRAALTDAYRTVWLDAPLDVLSTRIGPGEGRPLWDERRAQRYAERRPTYAEAELRIDTAGRSADEVVDEVIAWLG